MSRHGWLPGLSRMTLRRSDGAVYLDRWCVNVDRLGAVYLHRMEAPDPGWDLHDHPWAFVSVILKGGYVEERAAARDAQRLAYATLITGDETRCPRHMWRRWSIHRVGLEECHRIVQLLRPVTWTLIVRGPRRRAWGFYLPTGYINEDVYDRTVRALRRDLWSDQRAAGRPW